MPPLGYNSLESMATFHLVNFGCRASQADGAALKRQLLDAGLEEVSSSAVSQVAILNTCTVTANADAEVRQVIRRIHRANPACRILVTGCYAQRAPEEIAPLQGVTWVVGNSHKFALAELLKEDLVSKFETRNSKLLSQSSSFDFRISGFGVEKSGVPPLVQIHKPSPPQVLVGEISEEFHFAPVFPDDRTRPTLKIQDGCDARCSFCVIPYVRGASRSLAPGKVVEEVRGLAQQGFQEIVLSGINLGSYGRDLDRRITFLGLLELILSQTSIARVRISSIEPMDVGRNLIRLVAEEPRMARHFHVPLQSGCDRILRRMNRRYWTRQYAERILAIREQVPNCGIGADVMVGFPGETDEDHTASLRFIESLPFTYLHVFPYSARPRTPAALLPGQLNGRILRVRSREIRSLMAEKRRVFLAAQIGRPLSALTLDEATGALPIALTSNYLKVALPGSNARRNSLVEVWVERVLGEFLYGHLEGPARGTAAS